MTGTTTGQTALPTATDSDDNENFLTVSLTAALQALANLFESATGHDHAGSGKGKPIAAAGIGSGAVTGAAIASATVTADKLSLTTVNADAGADTAVAATTAVDVVNTGALAAGTWLIIGTLTFQMGGTGGILECRLSDGTVIHASASLSIVANGWGCTTVSYIGSGGVTYRLNAYSTQAGTAKQLGGGSSTAAATHIRAVRIG